MTEGALRVLKVPVPNSKHFAIRVKGHLVDCLEFDAQVFKDSSIVTSQSRNRMNIAVFVWCLIIETEQEETHEFVMVNTGEDFPMMDADIKYVASTRVPIPTGGEIELHLFHAGINEAMAKIDIPFPEEETVNP
jgi:hypothetical protein